jgi:hypothetical protein
MVQEKFEDAKGVVRRYNSKKRNNTIIYDDAGLFIGVST